MTELVTAAQMREIEAKAIASSAVTGLELMERAGAGVVDALLARWPKLADAPCRAVVLCGPGNNGGDGYVIARLLNAIGWDVAVFGMGERRAMPPDAAANRDLWEQLGPVAPLEDVTADGADLIVDAIFGTGLSRGFAPPARVGSLFHGLFADGIWGHGAELQPYVVAVDVPSGLDSDSGRVLWADSEWCGDIAAHLTVTFHTAKLGHMLADGPQQCGALEVVDIGLENTDSGVPMARLPDPMRADPSLGKGGAGVHKFHYGHALVLTGGMGRTGAARLAARGALRIGAGLVTLGARGSAMMECAAQVSAIMLRRCDDDAGLRDILEDDRINALCLGPGLGVESAQCDMVLAALEIGENRGARISVVLDADALSCFSGQPERLIAGLGASAVITPHGGEFARVFPDLAERLRARAMQGPAYSKLDATVDAARRADCVVVFKGADTIIAAPDGRVCIHASAYHRAAPWLATAGSGDVLAGFITGLLARGMDPFYAAQTAVWLHCDCARDFGPGLIAEDLPEVLPRVFRGLGL